MNFKEKLGLQKENGTGFTILLVLTVFFIFVNVYNPILFWIRNGGPITNNIINILRTLAPALIFGLIALILEKKKASFASHLLFFSIFLSNYPRLLFSNYNYDAIGFIFFFVGLIASIYTIVKMVAHFNEVDLFNRSLDRTIMVFLFLGLLRVYFDNGFANAMVMLVVMLAIMTTTKTRELLPLVAGIYAISFLDDVFLLVILGSAPLTDYLVLAFNMIIGAYIIYRTVTLYIDLNKDNLNFVQ